MRDLPMPASPESSATWPSPSRRVAPAVEEQRHFVLAPDEGRHALRPRRLEAADVLRLAQDRPGGNRRVEALQVLRPQAPSTRTRRPAAAASTRRSRRCPARPGACNRAARLGVSPTTACSCADPCPTRSPTTTMPVAMPMRTFSATLRGRFELRDDGRRCPGRLGPPVRRPPHGRAESRNRPAPRRP